jgi:DNA-binding NtrC family response regulator
MPVNDFVLARAEEESPLLATCERRSILCINNEKRQHLALQAIVQDLSWQMRSAMTCLQALQMLGSQPTGAIFCDAVLTDGTWRDILQETGAGVGAPPLIVTSRLADACLWSEVLNLGGYDVLATPFTAPEVAHVLANITFRTALGQKYAAAGRG